MAVTLISILHSAISACDKCVVAGYLASASPRSFGNAPADFMVIGQAPSLTDRNSGGALYVGPAGLKLRGWLREAGFSEGDFGTTVYMTALTKCFPGRLPGNSKDRAPSRAELKLCRTWLDEEILLVRPKIVVLFGKMAIGEFVDRDLSLEECVGRAYRRDGVIYVPLPHSSGASTWLNNPAHKEQVVRAIALIRALRTATIQNYPIDQELIIEL